MIFDENTDGNLENHFERFNYFIKRLQCYNSEDSGVKVMNLKRFSCHRFGYNGTLIYREKIFSFTVAPDEEDSEAIFQVLFPLKIYRKYTDRVFMMTFLADTIIGNEGQIMLTADDEIILFKAVSLTEQIDKSSLDNTIRSMGSIIYAFAPYLWVIGNGRYPFRNYKGESAIGRMVSELIPSGDNNINNSANWFDGCEYCEEKWYIVFLNKYDEFFNIIAKRIEGYKESI